MNLTNPITWLGRFFAFAAWWLVWWSGSIRGADIVRVAPADGDGPAFGIEGQIVDYTGREIVVLPVRGTERRFPADRVVEIETPWPVGYEQGVRALEEHDFETAQELLLAANRAEGRTWARRIILGRLAQAMLGLGQVEQAADVVLAILASDPTSEHFELLPLAWSGDAMVSRSKAEAWLKRANSPAANLLGASHLLSTNEGGSKDVLQGLAAGPDVRIAALAEAQLWRTRIAIADAAEVERWQAAIERMPADVRGGPSFVVGQTLRRLGRTDEAALAFLRLPIHAFPQRELSARAVVAAAECVHESGCPEEAVRLLREVLDNYADTPSTRPAKALMRRLGG